MCECVHVYATINSDVLNGADVGTLHADIYTYTTYSVGWAPITDYLSLGQVLVKQW